MTILVLGGAVGLLLGLTGAGGSVLAVPLLVLGLGWSVVDATPVALLAVSVAALVGTAATWDVRHVRYRAAALMAAAGLLAAPLGLHAATLLRAELAAVLFAGVLLVVAVRLLMQARAPANDTPLTRICGIDPETARFNWTPRCALLMSATGATSGFLSGLLGVGGGFVVVPALRAASPLSMHSAVATSLLAIGLTSAGTVVLGIAMGRGLPWSVAAPFVTGAIGGILAGRRLAPRLAGPVLQQVLAASMFVVAGLMVSRHL